ncbi:hypothetical protein HMPREF1544_04632 [Mucor circinelloides 1006PhL]|uniref:Uncharacterized protein n=1 Tax=Mucor circinelloides f. circinelloides (strain 1006PhL) TaxID=1220926 RepID=S2JF66_MUCC1|nr:hypothetical protein HMPREF1544_04632 [Mucor circinelloides 1006PhL]
MKSWGNWWWKQDTTPVKSKHHKHHKHYRHHHHHPQVCIPQPATTATTSGVQGTPSGGPIPIEVGDPFFPHNIGGMLNDTGVNCSDSLTTQAYARFNAIFFGNFITSEAQDIVGPLAVAGDFSAHAYTVNTQHGANCTDVTNNFNGYGLIVGEENPAVIYSDVHVHGAVFLPDGSSRGNIQELDSACSVYNDRGTGLMNFTQVKLNAIEAAQQFALMSPTLHLSSDGTLTRLSESIIGYDVITFGSCTTCSYDSNFSSPDAIYYGQGNWNGPMGMSWPSKLIINIAVLTNTTITIQGNQPSLGMNVCNTVLNFYPSDNVGFYQSGPFQVDRSTGGQLGGFMLLPEGDIIDENHGEFAGQIVANNYRWSGSGIEIHDYYAIGGSCLTTDVCIPVFVNDTIDNRPHENYNPENDTSSSQESSTDSSSSQESSSDDSTITDESSSVSSEESNEESSSSSSRSGAELSSSTESSESSTESSESSAESSESTLSSSNSENTESSSSESTDNSSQSSESNGESDSSSDSSNDLSSSSSSSDINSSSSEISSIESSTSSNENSSSSDSNTNSSPTVGDHSNSISSSYGTPTSTQCPTETSATVICHTHQHHVTRTQYQCEQGFFHDEEVLVCQDDSHHHHRKDYYAGNDDDNFEDDPEFGLYDFNQFDEECDIDHGVVNDYDQEDRYYKYKGKKYYDDSEYDDDEEEDDDEDEDEDDDEDDDEEEDEDEGKGKDRHY